MEWMEWNGLVGVGVGVAVGVVEVVGGVEVVSTSRSNRMVALGPQRLTAQP